MKSAIHCGLTLLLLIAPAYPQHMNEKDSPCGESITSDLVKCLSKARMSADAKLNAAYKNAVDSLRKRPGDAERLRNAERLWMQYRDANCEAERGLYDGGTGAAPAYLACVESMTRARTKELEVVYGWVIDK